MAGSRLIILGEETTLVDGEHSQFVEQAFTDVRHPKREGKWPFIRPVGKGSVVLVAPVTRDRQIILADIYRKPLKKRVIELCAGSRDDPNKSETDVAAEEVRQELGYKCDEYELLTRAAVAGAITDATVALYLGTNAREVGDQQLGFAEDIEALAIPIAALRKYLFRQVSELGPDRVDIKVWSACAFLEGF